MAYIRWLHKSWNAFWTFIGVCVLTVAILLGVIFGIMQLQPVKDQLALQIQKQFSEKYEGVISIGSIQGLVPFQITLKNVNLYPDSTAYIPVMATSQISAGIDLRSLFQNKVIVNSLQIDAPEIWIDPESELSLENAFKPKYPADTVAGEEQGLDVEEAFDFQIIIPSLIVNDGTVVIRNLTQPFKSLRTPDSLQIKDLQLDLFFEYTQDQRFIDMNKVSFRSPETQLGLVELYGQIYNDDKYLELNSINIRTDDARFQFSGEAEGVNLLEGGLKQQIEDAPLSLIVDRFSITSSYLNKWIPFQSPLTSDFQGSLKGEGTLNSIYVTDAEWIIGDSYTNFNGMLTGLRDRSSLNYQVSMEALILGEKELEELLPQLSSEQRKALATTRYEGDFSGNTRELGSKIKAIGDRGALELEGSVGWEGEHPIQFDFKADSLNLGYLINPRIQRSNLSFRGNIRSNSLDPEQAEGRLQVDFKKGMLDNRIFDDLKIIADWDNGRILPDIEADVDGAQLSSSGMIDLTGALPEFSLKGKADNLNLTEVVQDPNMRSVYADLEYDLDVKGMHFDNLYGQLSLDLIQAYSEGDTLGRHQLYVDLNEPNSEIRILRFTSTAFDATVQGQFSAGEVFTLSDQWLNYFQESWRKEFLFEDEQTASLTGQFVENQDLYVNGRLKNLSVLSFYFPDIPVVQSSARVNATVNVNSERLLFNSTIVDPGTRVRDFGADSLVLQVTAGFRSDTLLKEFSEIQMKMDAAKAQYGEIVGSDISMVAELRGSDFTLRHSIAKLGQNASFEMETSGEIMPDRLRFQIQNFVLGTPSYSWINNKTPLIEYRSDKKLVLQEFEFVSNDQFVMANGTFSNSTEDSVKYNFGKVNLDRISSFIGGRIQFGGILDGRITTKTLTTIPTVQGNLDVERLTFNETLFGDLGINSFYNPEFDRFDTRISVQTDSSKYPEYFENNNRKGQNFDIEGYVMAPKEGKFPEADSLYRFNVDFKNIDLWILPLIGPKIFVEGSGLATGEGVIWGSKDDYDYEADFMVGADDAAYMKPKFLDTYYYAQGALSFTRDRGLSFKDIYLIDPSGGNAILSGYYDFNDFSPIADMNISLDMDEFQFLNSSFDPTLAFYGKAYGSSTVTISGTNLAPVLRTEQPIQISDFSEISIPLLEETDFNEDNRFIRFVETFDLDENGRSQYRNGTKNGSVNGVDEIPQDLTFAERFTLDLQFVANNPMTVQLIFDPVTGDIVTAEGTGRMRILLEDEQVSMFGRFDILGGRYQFVSGDIFTRRFELASGGTIIWEGDPANARLNLKAIYSARPDINSLSNTGRRDPENTQRVPVELVLNIGGTITSIENNFYFQLPNTFESQQNSTLTTQLASINRDEDLKLLQAANFMLMGDFIPVSSTGEAQNNLFGDNISGSAAVLNPLLSSQVINPLLSNQVNSLLNSDLSSLDVDFNLNTYNQVDLGVALRLYNDKLILRREGQITGRQSNIGDLGATYRINRTFAVTAFHRQDLTFGTISSTEQSQQSQDINGVGLEAKVSFNTWDEFFKRLFSPFRKLFGTDNREKNQEELTDNR